MPTTSWNKNDVKKSGVARRRLVPTTSHLLDATIRARATPDELAEYSAKMTLIGKSAGESNLEQSVSVIDDHSLRVLNPLMGAPPMGRHSSKSLERTFKVPDR